MKFVYEPELLLHMQQKGLKTIAVEVIDAQNSDFEIQDFHVRLVNERMKNLFITERKYRSVPTEHGDVLLPNYHLEYDDTITFGLKKFLCFKSVSFSGIRF